MSRLIRWIPLRHGARLHVHDIHLRQRQSGYAMRQAEQLVVRSAEAHPVGVHPEGGRRVPADVEDDPASRTNWRGTSTPVTPASTTRCGVQSLSLIHSCIARSR